MANKIRIPLFLRDTTEDDDWEDEFDLEFERDREKRREERGINTVLTISGREIQSLGELREAIQEKEAIESIHGYLKDGTLFRWLAQYFYQHEAYAVSKIDAKSNDWLRQLAKVLKVSYDPLNGQILREDEEYRQRVALVKEAAGDEADKLPDNVNLVALNQKELATLLYSKTKKIYLCKGEFSIPITKKGVHYVCINHPVVENLFTKKQYQRMQIEIEGIDIPESVDEEKEDFAERTAAKSGYDFFYENHSPLANAFHSDFRLRHRQFWENIFLPYNESIVSKDYHTMGEAKQAVREFLRKGYDEGNALFEVEGSKSLTRKVVAHYKEELETYYSLFSRELHDYCNTAGKMELLKEIDGLVRGCGEYMKKEMTAELADNRDYYKLYDFDYFCNQVDIEENDSSLEENPVWHFLETVIAETKTYTFADVFASREEIEKDVNHNAEAFYKVAEDTFQERIRELEEKINLVGQGLDDMEKEENIAQYLVRMTKKAS